MIRGIRHVPSSPGTPRPSRDTVARALEAIAAIGRDPRADALTDWAAELRAERDATLRRAATRHLCPALRLVP